MTDDRAREKGPTDEEILAYSQAIQDSATLHTHLVGPRLSVLSLLDDYGGPENLLLRRKIRGLHPPPHESGASGNGEGEGWLRRTRGDGNCFYRAVGFALLDAARRDASLAEKVTSRIGMVASQVLDRAGFSAIVYEDFQDVFRDLLSSHPHHIAQADIGKEDALWVAMNDAEQSNAVVVYLRFLTSAWLKCHRASYEAYLEEGQVLERWCERWVEAIGAEADSIQINALVNALQLGVDVVQLDHAITEPIPSHEDDGEESPYKAAVLQVRPDEGEVMGVVKVLYRPGHYDVYY